MKKPSRKLLDIPKQYAYPDEKAPSKIHTVRAVIEFKYNYKNGK